ncbi:nucleoside/nucleotide kinase family protein [Protaetiibacter mangrovi]|uniref:Nucleoside/nucleotide kinase family protein n=1 Tax=Protaetiibacter mangrovi TaxID=2970926 RepID=A0ABT1ZCL0_9MICO|nr:nucleoside/nucleotide kinase family protein [Protaetiibacter mangrovi]MCS0498424.1 nucleoside/nucleotide kinase family protein [Protaetiibacter mangrovi]
MNAAGFADELRARAAAGARVIAGLAGEPGAGKSTVAARLAAELGPDAAVLPMDGFHLPQARLVELGRRERMGAADTFDVDAFVAVLQRVRADYGEVRAPGFDRDVEEPVPDAIRIRPEHRIVVVEGNYLLHDQDGWERVLGLLDASAYLALDPETRRARLIARHVAHGKDPDAARAWALGPDEANAALIRGTACRADEVLAVD